MEDLRAVVADAEELLKATADQAGERIAAARGKAEESLKAAKARLNEQDAAVRAKTKAAAKCHRRLREGQSLEGHGNSRGSWFRPLHPGQTPLSRVNGLLGMGSGTDRYDPLGAHDQPCQDRAGKL